MMNSLLFICVAGLFSLCILGSFRPHGNAHDLSQTVVVRFQPVTPIEVISDPISSKMAYIPDAVLATIYEEARCQPFHGQIAILYVIMNRSGIRSESITEVATNPALFECWAKNDLRSVLISGDFMEWKAGFLQQYEEMDVDEIPGHLLMIFTMATHYHNPSLAKPGYYKNPAMAEPRSYNPDRVIPLGQVGDHVFYCFTRELENLVL